jgi:hypothetical protein
MRQELFLPAILAGALGFASCSSEPSEAPAAGETVASETVSFQVSGMT